MWKSVWRGLISFWKDFDFEKWDVIRGFCTKQSCDLFVLMECACFAVWRIEYRENGAKSRRLIEWSLQ